MLEGVLRGARTLPPCQFCFLRSLNFLLFCKCMNWPGTGKVSKITETIHTGRGGMVAIQELAFCPRRSSQDLFRVWSQDVPSQGVSARLLQRPLSPLRAPARPHSASPPGPEEPHPNCQAPGQHRPPL